MSRPNELSKTTQLAALWRQRFRCGSCGAAISDLGDAGRTSHDFGEGVDAHHVRHVQQEGDASVENCVILCWSCHYSAHEGGNYGSKRVKGSSRDYPYFEG